MRSSLLPIASVTMAVAITTQTAAPIGLKLIICVLAIVIVGVEVFCGD